MVDRHNKSFFGKKTGMIFDSGLPTTPAIFLTFIKKKGDGTWEKPSKKEGTTIKLSLEDIGFVLRVLRRSMVKWDTVHSFKGKKTPISFTVNVMSDEPEKLKIKAGGIVKEQVLKELNPGELEVFKTLLVHVFQEKIANSTVVPKRQEDTETTLVDLEGDGVPNLLVTEEKFSFEQPDETSALKGVVKNETEKALLIEFAGGKEIWVPKYTIRSSYDASLDSAQSFRIDSWILRKNNLI